MQGLVSLTKRFCHFHEQGHVQKFDNKLHSHSVRERIWIEANDYHRVKVEPLRSQNHNELKSSTVGPTNKKKIFFPTKIFF